MNPSLHYIDAGYCAPMGGDHRDCEAFWRRIKAQHVKVYGPDSAYNHSICNAHGIVMIGRGWDRDSAANGVQGGVSYNPGSRAMVALMCGQDDPSAALVSGVADWTNEAYRRGMSPPLRPHSFFVSTTCCGDKLRWTVEMVNQGGAPSPIPIERKVNPKMWIAWIHAVNWCDVYYNGVLVDAFTNDDNVNAFGVGDRLQRYINQGATVTSFADEAAYAGTRKRLADAAA